MNADLLHTLKHRLEQSEVAIGRCANSVRDNAGRREARIGEMGHDRDYSPFGKRRPATPPRLYLLDRCWRLRAIPTGRELVCGIFQTDVGLEVRAG